MSRKIRIMPGELSSKIAAGEVVERPSSIIKELLENSLDAGATTIAIDLAEGGKESIRVVDDGEGIDPDDVAIAFERYATSKIYHFDDIYRLASFGFRGEALASIASVSKIEVLTRQKNAIAGTKAIIEGGIIKEIGDIGCPAGTSLQVNDLFYLTPVRKKFLKQNSTELAHCIEAVTQLALANYGVKIIMTANKRTVLNLPKTDNIHDRIALIYGREFQKNMRPVVSMKGSVDLRGFISNAAYTRSNSKAIMCYINNRYVRDKILINAVLSSYKHLIPARRYPCAILFIQMPQEEVDVNIHPSKMEVRFRNSREVYSLVLEGISERLAQTELFPEAVSHRVSYQYPKRDQDYRLRVSESLKRYTINSRFQTYQEKPRQLQIEETKIRRDKHEHVFESGSDKKGLYFSSLEYLGQVAGTYLIFSDNDSLLLIDQHAAHERVLFEKLRKEAAASQAEEAQQGLLIPEVITLDPKEYSILMDNIDFLKKGGILVEPYGGNTVVVKSLPSILRSANIKTLLQDVVDEIGKMNTIHQIEDMKNKLFTLMACRHAIKAHHTISTPEVEALCRDLDSIPYAGTCPHGRPTYIKIEPEDLEIMFKRK